MRRDQRMPDRQDGEMPHLQQGDSGRLLRRPPMADIPREIAAVADYIPYARERLDDNAWAYIAGGAADELTLDWNRASFDRLRLKPRVLTPVAGGHTRTTLFGVEYRHPVLLAPVAYQRLAHPDGELAVAQAAAATDTGMVVSTLSSQRLEDIAAVPDALLWFQLYLQHDRGFTRSLVERAEASACRALMVTVDAPINGVRNREQRAGFRLPSDIAALNLQGMPMPPQRELRPDQSMVFDGLMPQAPTWADLDWLRGITSLPLVIKGILSPEDAARAADMGADGVVVSNHGGRTLDTLPAAIDALPAIADAVGGRLTVLLDGGIRRGTDVLKAVALGARAVLVGRPYLYGLAAAGPLGVAHVVRILRDELEAAMALTGCATIGDIGREVLFDSGSGQRTPSVTSAK
jgi:4-hydroxymandelate oxidase